MIEQGLGFYIISVLVLVMLMVFSIVIPFYGFIRNRWKGLAIGCLLQPVCFALVCVLFFVGVYLYQKYELNGYRNAAMVSVKKTDANGDTHIWHMKTDDECFYECREKGMNSDFLSYDLVKLFDVVPMDSTAVCVDDKIVVRFDLGKHQVTAFEHDEPIEVANVNWDKVKEYWQQQRSTAQP